MSRNKPADQLAGYGNLLRQMSEDLRLNITHISLATGLFVLWQRNGFIAPFPVTRRTLMCFSKIGSIATYHKCLRELNDYGYLIYQPSYHPKNGSRVEWSAGHGRSCNQK
jgi:hypothetical protein